MNDIVTPDFNEMTIGKLREYASHMHIPLAKTATKDEIKSAIRKKLAGRTSAVIADKDSTVPPGHAKILINEDPTPGSKNIPVFLNANGYMCTIPRGKEVIVPMRVVRVLQDAKTKRRTQTAVPDNFGREVYRETTVVVPSYPFQLIEVTPGPEPLTNHEKQKQKSNGPRQRYADMFGHWPRPIELRRAIEKGLVKLHDNEIADVQVSDMIEETEEESED